MSTTGISIVYRGQLEIERSRIEFIISAASLVCDFIDFIHLSPGIGSDEEDLRAFVSSFPRVRRAEFVSAPMRRSKSARRQLMKLIEKEAPAMVVVGFSAWPFVRGIPCTAWCINGIPEERLLTSPSRFNRAAVRGSWLGAKTVRPHLTVAVSDPMARLIASRTRSRRIVAIPNAVDRSTYQIADGQPPTHLTYQGGGSPWQGLERLSQVWAEIHALDPDVKFRVISTDTRTRVLGRGLPSSAIDFTSAKDAQGVAALLSEVRLGFLYREPTLVNCVSWPMKFGEYLAAGAPVVVSDCGWDLAEIVKKHDAGLVVSWDAPPRTTAYAITEYLIRLDGKRPSGVCTAAQSLDSSMWQQRLAGALQEAITT